MTKKVITRIAPSPTGPLHVGTARTALFNYLFAKKHKGKFFVRIEDTDRRRSKKEFEKDIIDNLAWLGFEHDGLTRQSERTALYKKVLKNLIDKNFAYVSKESKKDNPSVSIEVVRLRNPGREITFNDLVRGKVTFNTKELGDFVIARSIEEPLYHVAVVVDDYEMEISHILRGEDHISNTPRQILIQEALGYHIPQYGHLPLILGSDRSKLSKRHGAVSVSVYKQEGYIPEALVNYLALLGWNPDSDKEIFSCEELIEAFDIEEIHKAGAVFDLEKLKWFNREYLKILTDDVLLEETAKRLPESIRILPQYSEKRLRALLSVLRERISVVSEIEKLAHESELTYFFDVPSIETTLIWKSATSEITKKHLESLTQILKSIPDNKFSKVSIESVIDLYAKEQGRGEVLWPFRVALTGKEKSPGPYEIAEILGKQEVLSRIKAASGTL